MHNHNDHLTPTSETVRVIVLPNHTAKGLAFHFTLRQRSDLFQFISMNNQSLLQSGYLCYSVEFQWNICLNSSNIRLFNSSPTCWKDQIFLIFTKLCNATPFVYLILYFFNWLAESGYAYSDGFGRRDQLTFIRCSMSFFEHRTILI